MDSSCLANLPDAPLIRHVDGYVDHVNDGLLRYWLDR